MGLQQQAKILETGFNRVFYAFVCGIALTAIGAIVVGLLPVKGPKAKPEPSSAVQQERPTTEAGYGLR